MSASIPASTLEKFTTFGDLLRYLRRVAGLTQIELSVQVGYSHAQISRLEQNLRMPDIPTVEARFIPALGMEDEPKVIARLLDLAANARREDSPGLGLCPYKGLSYFDESDADLFVGREALTAKLTERVLSLTESDSPLETRFLAIVGASGSGKSSLARAGLVPALRWKKESSDWQIYIFTPTAHPLESLSASLTSESSSVIATSTLTDDLARDPRSLQIFIKRHLPLENHAHALFVIDQFEEVFALCRSEEERAAFIGNLLTAASETDGPVIVVITLRADFYAHCANYIDLREALAKNQEYIGVMNHDEVRRAIEEPAQRGRWEFEPGLVDLLLHDVGHEPGALPLLSHALFEVWQRRRGRAMTLSGYASSGGVRGAIAETAETVFTDQFTREQQVIARKIFLRLTELGDENSAADTRRRATFHELVLNPEEESATHAVLKALADARLIITSEDSAEVAHEALIREWPTLRGWLEENREGLRLHRQLTEAAQEWREMDRAPDMLYRGARLAQTSEWASNHADEMNALEREFLAASIAASEHEAAEREAQRQRELESAKELAETQRRFAYRLKIRNRVITAVASIAFILALLTGLFGLQSSRSAVTAQENAATAQVAKSDALNQQATAEAERSRAESENQLATSRELALAANSNLDLDPELSLLLSLHALSVARTSEAESALHSAVQASRVHITLQEADGWNVEYSPDGTRLATSSGEGDQGMVKIWDAATGQELLSVAVPKVGDFKFNADGTRLAIASAEKAGIWDAATGEQLLSISGHTKWIQTLAFSADETLLATASEDHTAKVWDLATGQELLTLRGHTDIVNAVEFNPDGTQLATSSWGNITKIWDLATGQEVLTFPAGLPSYTPDGQQVLAYGPDGSIISWDTVTGQELSKSSGPPGYGIGIITTDRQKIIHGTLSGKVIVWDIATEQELFSFPAHVSSITDIAIHPDGIHLATSSADGTVKIWDLSPQGSREWLTLSGLTGPGPKAIFSPDGRRLATPGRNNTAIIWNAATGKALVTFTGHADELWDIAFSPDGSRLATSSMDFTTRIWDTKTGKELLKLSSPGHGDGVIGGLFSGIIALAFSPDGKRLATAGADGTAIVWDATTGQSLLTLTNQGIGLTNLAFSPDGMRLATGTENILTEDIATIWDLATGKKLLNFNMPARVWGLAFSPDGEKLLLSGAGGVVKMWDAHTGEFLFPLVGHTNSVLDFAFSPNGLQVASVSNDGTAKVWNASNGKELLTLRGHTSGVTSVAFSPDGTRLATAGNDGTARVYLLKIEELIALATSRLTRSLTTEECQKYLHAEHCPSDP